MATSICYSTECEKYHQNLQTQAQKQFYNRISSQDVAGVTLNSKDQVWQCVVRT